MIDIATIDHLDYEQLKKEYYEQRGKLVGCFTRLRSSNEVSETRALLIDVLQQRIQKLKLKLKTNSKKPKPRGRPKTKKPVGRPRKKLKTTRKRKV